MIAPLLAMIAETQVSGSLPVKESVMMSPSFAYAGLVLELYSVTNGSVGLVPNEVKWLVSKLHSCWIHVSILALQTKLLSMLELFTIVPLVSLTTILSTLPIPFGN